MGVVFQFYLLSLVVYTWSAVAAAAAAAQPVTEWNEMERR